MKKHIPAIAMLILPVVLLKITTSQLGHATAQSVQASTGIADTESTPPSSKVIAPAPWTPLQIVAAGYIEATRNDPFGPTPFLVEKAQTSAVPEPIKTPDSDESTALSAVPEFSVGAVMSAASGSRALVNGKPYRKGDLIKDTTWMIVEIDSSKRTVTFHDTESDRSVVGTVEKP